MFFFFFLLICTSGLSPLRQITSLHKHQALRQLENRLTDISGKIKACRVSVTDVGIRHQCILNSQIM